MNFQTRKCFVINEKLLLWKCTTLICYAHLNYVATVCSPNWFVFMLGNLPQYYFFSHTRKRKKKRSDWFSANIHFIVGKTYYMLLRVAGVFYQMFWCVFLLVVHCILTILAGSSKYNTTCENIHRYYLPKTSL